MTHTCSHSSSTGQALAQVPPMMFSLEDGDGRAARVAGGDLANEPRNVDAGRAGLDARRIVAEQAATGFHGRLQRRKARVQVAEVVR